MLIVGAKGFAKEVLEVLHQDGTFEGVCFFDDVNQEIPDILYDRFRIIKNLEDASLYFQNVDNKFTLGIGNPTVRKILYDKFNGIGGKFTSTISPKSNIGNFGNRIDCGCNIMTGTVITNDVTISKGCLVNLNCTIGHDCFLGNFVELCPGVNISGNCNIGDYSFVGTNATLLPKIEVGTNVVIAAGSVVTKNVPDNCMVAGIPAVVKKELPPLKF